MFGIQPTIVPSLHIVRNQGHYHAVVWLDHREARVIYFSRDASNEVVVLSDTAGSDLHYKSGSASGTHRHGKPEFFRKVADACNEAKAVLLTGPSTARQEFMAYLAKRLPQTAALIAAIETSARITDPQLLAEGRRFFAMHNRTPLAS